MMWTCHNSPSLFQDCSSPLDIFSQKHGSVPHLTTAIMKTILIHSPSEFCVRYLAMSATTFIDLSSTKIYSCLHCSKFYCCSGSGSRDLLTVPGLTKCPGWAFSEKSLTVLMCSLMLILEPVTHSAVYCQEEIKTRVRGLESKKALGDLLLTPVRLG